MIKKIEEKRDWLFYTCKDGDSLESVANLLHISKEEILKSNPMFSKIYAGCVLYICGLGKVRTVVAPLENLESIAQKYGTTVEKIKQDNNLKSDKVFVGMQLTVSTGESNEKDSI